MNAWSRYWQNYGLRDGLVNAVMATVIVVSGLGMVGGIIWLFWIELAG